MSLSVVVESADGSRRVDVHRAGAEGRTSDGQRRREAWDVGRIRREDRGGQRWSKRRTANVEEATEAELRGEKPDPAREQPRYLVNHDGLRPDGDDQAKRLDVGAPAAGSRNRRANFRCRARHGPASAVARHERADVATVDPADDTRPSQRSSWPRRSRFPRHHALTGLSRLNQPCSTLALRVGRRSSGDGNSRHSGR